MLRQRKMLNIYMSLSESSKKVEKYIKVLTTAKKRNFSSSAQRLAYERGLLTGLLIDLIDTDTYVDFKVRKKIDEAENLINQSKK